MKGFDTMFSYEIKKELACEMIEYIENYGIQDMYLCDIAHELYNNDYYIIGIYQAKEWLKKYETSSLSAESFSLISFIKSSRFPQGPTITLGIPFESLRFLGL